MSKIVGTNSFEDNRFKTISDFEDCMIRGGEVEFVCNDKKYNITHCQSGEIGISEAFKQETEKLCKSADEILEYMIDGVRLRDIITEVKVWVRTI